MTILTIVNAVSITALKRKIKALVFGAKDVRECSESAPFGIDSSPIKGMVAVYSDTVTSGRQVIIGYINANQIADAGEFRAYSLKADGSLCTYIMLHNVEGSGQIEIGGTADYAVKFSGLQSQFDELKGKFNGLVTKFNSHTHGGVMAGGGFTAITATPATASLADITAAKNEKIKTL